MLINLRQITIVSINCVDPYEGAKALLYSCKNICFKEAILFTDTNVQIGGIRTIKIDNLKSVDEYNDFVLRLSEYINSDYVLLIQDDGYVINSNMWSNEFLKYDYIGALWPKEQSWIERQQTKKYMVGDWNRVGNGGFSLRSKKFMELSAHFKSCEGVGEDVFLCLKNYGYMKQHGINFAPIELAKKFSYENNIDNWQERVELDVNKHFGFHGKELLNSQYLISLKG